MLKYLRIAVKAFSLTSCVLLTGLWAWSYFRYPQQLFYWKGHVGYITHGRAYFDYNERFDSYLKGWEVHGTPFRLNSGTATALPLLIPMALTAGLAIAPWHRQFSLRTLLIATTLVAAGLGVIISTS